MTVKHEQTKSREQLNTDQATFLMAFCDRVSDDITKSVKVWDIGDSLAWDEGITRRVTHNLARRGLLQVVGIGGLYTVTSDGVRVARNQ
jgi:hypothetical protein